MESNISIPKTATASKTKLTKKDYLKTSLSLESLLFPLM